MLGGRLRSLTAGVAWPILVWGWRHLPVPIKRYGKLIYERRYNVLLRVYEKEGLNEAKAYIEEKKNLRFRSNAYKIIARKILSKDVTQAAELVKKCLHLDSSEHNRRWSCMTLWDAGYIKEAFDLLQTLNPSHFTPGETEKSLQIQGAYRLMTALPEVPTQPNIARYKPDRRRILYVASSSRPYHMTGYTARTHHLLEAIRAEGWDIYCVTRPGYPHDRPDTRNLNEQNLHHIDGVPYERLDGTHRREIAYDEYLTNSVEVLLEAAQRIRPAIIHAASNYEAALPALIVARRLGIGFCYEVRGLWEFTAASKKGNWEKTERFQLDRLLEAHTARHADGVFTLTKALANELSARGVPTEHIQLLPNAVNLAFFKPTARDRLLARTLGLKDDTFVCGYIGSVVKYEGLDDLITAWKTVVDAHPNSRLLIVGDGDELNNLVLQAKRQGIDKQITFTGRVAHGEVRRFFSLFNAIALPRKPLDVCKLVSPLKPFEAMAMKVPLVVSDVDALGEIFVDGQTALLHKAGDSESLAKALITLAQDPLLQRRLSANAFNQVCMESQWEQVIRSLCNFYRKHEIEPTRELMRKQRLRVLTVGSLPPEWGGATRGGVASIHQVILEQWLSKTKGEGIEVVGTLANNWSGQPGTEKPDALHIFVPPADKKAEREWYQSLLQQENLDAVLFFHIANRWGYWYAQMQPVVPAVASIHSWSAVKAVNSELAVSNTTKLHSVLPSFQQVIFPSRHCMDEGVDLGFDYHHPVMVIPNTVHRSYIETPLALIKKKVVFVGSLTPNKRADLVIRAAAQLGIDLVLIGDGIECESLQELAVSLNFSASVEFIGQQSTAQIANILVESSLLCVPSESESFGIVYLEALACGIPVVGFAPTLVELEEALDMRIGVGVASNGDLQAIVNAIQQALSLELDRQALRDAVARRYSPRAISDSYLRVLQQTAATSLKGIA